MYHGRSAGQGVRVKGGIRLHAVPTMHTTSRLMPTSSRHFRSWTRTGHTPMRTPRLIVRRFAGQASPQPPRNISIRRFSTAEAVCGLTLFGGIFFAGYQVWLYHKDKEIQEERERDELDFVVFPQPKDFEHPYYELHWGVRCIAKFFRTVYLCYLFTPVLFVYFIVRYTDNDPAWRRYYLDLLTDTMQRSGCAFQKFGQWLSMRPDCFNPDTITALSQLHANVTPHDMQHNHKTFRESFGVELEDVFSEFDPVPVASGTIGQVHRAVLRGDLGLGPEQPVAVKIRHPRVLEQTWLDLDIIWNFCSDSHYMRLPFQRDEWVRAMQKQIDFQWEAHYLTQFRRNFREEVKQGTLSFPDVIAKYTSPVVLVETWAAGEQVSHIFSVLGKDMKEVKESNTGFSQGTITTKKKLASTLFDFAVKCFLRDNLVHGDLHGGNVLFDHNRCTILDAGLTTTLGKDVKNTFFNFISSVCTNHPDDVLNYVLQFQDPAAGPVLSEKEEPTLRREITQVLSMYSNGGGTSAEGGEMLLGDCCGKLMLLCNQHSLVLRGDVASSIVTLSLCEGLIKMLDPDFDIVKRALPYLARYRKLGGYVDEEGNYLP
eukprot:gb/GEZN01005035.1/.p1 GENE.gb/GEZN01005035.1/~~gb/GEZN01005035.1/.p1  ORF type:complete len:598 (-),score=20.27 gb/GEZN01005035.1/:14-1807(-)